MNIRPVAKVLALFTIAVVTLSACGGGGNSGGGGGDEVVDSKRAGINEVIIYESANPDKLNPFTSQSASSGYIEGNIFMGLMGVDPNPPYDYIPGLAEARPELTEITEGEYAGGFAITYKIRPEAVWDNGEPVTGHDVAFTLKVIKNPHTDAGPIRPYMEFIDAVEVNTDNPKEFTMYTTDRYFMSEIWSAITVYPEYVYDPDHIMKDYTVKELNAADKQDAHMGDPALRQFADEFNSEKYQREIGYVVGCGPYELEEWVTGQRVKLKKKENWWGDQLAGKAEGFEANPERIIYEIINDQTTATTALKGEDLDVMRAIKPLDFLELQKDDKFLQKYNMHSPKQLAYSYIGINMKNPKLSDKKVRQALAHTVNVETIIENVMYGLAERVVGPINPTKPYYNNDLELIAYDLDKAKALFAEAGWTDTDGDGIIDKMIAGKKTPMVLSLKYPSGSELTEKIMLIIQEDAMKVGVKMELQAKEWTVFLDENKAHDFELYSGGWVSAPTLADPKQIWHTTSYDGGSNYVGFGNAESDALIDELRYNNDEASRTEQYMRFQEIVYDEQPYIFLFSSLNRLAIHARFDNADASIGRPGYQETKFILNPNFGNKAVAEQ